MEPLFRLVLRRPALAQKNPSIILAQDSKFQADLGKARITTTAAPGDGGDHIPRVGDHDFGRAGAQSCEEFCLSDWPSFHG